MIWKLLGLQLQPLFFFFSFYLKIMDYLFLFCIFIFSKKTEKICIILLQDS